MTDDSRTEAELSQVRLTMKRLNQVMHDLADLSDRYRSQNAPKDAAICDETWHYLEDHLSRF